MKQTGVICELPGPHTTVWRESNKWSFPKGECITCPDCHSHGIWQDVISSPSSEPDEPIPRQYSICVLGCMDCVRENGWTWGEQHDTSSLWPRVHSSNTIPIPANGTHTCSYELNNIEVIEEIVYQLWCETPDNPLWSSFYDRIPERSHLILNHIFDRTDQFPGNQEMGRGYAQQIQIYLQEGLSRGTYEEGDNITKVKEHCQQIVSILDTINQEIPEGSYLELMNLVGEIHKCQ